MLDVPEDVRFGFAWTRVHNLHVNECGCFAHNGVPARSCEQINTKRLSRPLTSWQFLLASPLGSQPLADKRGRPTVTVHAQCFSTGGATCTSIARMHNELPLPADLAWPRTVGCSVTAGRFHLKTFKRPHKALRTPNNNNNNKKRRCSVV